MVSSLEQSSFQQQNNIFHIITIISNLFSPVMKKHIHAALV